MSKSPDPRTVHTYILESPSEEDTLEFGKSLAAHAQPGDVFCLEGPLGAGKTLFARGFARGLGIDEPVTSPTFPIIQEYESDPPLYHMDLYRLRDSDDFIETGGLELMEARGICLIEWPERAADIMPDQAFWIRIEVTGMDSRRILISGPEDRIKELAHGL